MLVERLHFAIEWVHEVVHALQCAREPQNGQFDTEPFFHGDEISAFEKRVFGGHLSLLNGERFFTTADNRKKHRSRVNTPSSLVGIPVLWDWPLTWLVKNYLHSNLTMYPRSGWDAAGRVRANDMGWRVFPEVLEQFNTEAFWGNANRLLDFKHHTSKGAMFYSDRTGGFNPTPLSQGDIAWLGVQGHTEMPGEMYIKRSGT